MTGCTFVLVVGDEVLQLVGVHHNVEPAHLGQPEFLVVYAREADLLPCPGTEYKEVMIWTMHARHFKLVTHFEKHGGY